MLQPVEIKSGQTIAGDTLKGLLKWRSLARSPLVQPWVVFGEEGAYTRQDVMITGWREAVRKRSVPGLAGAGQTAAASL